MQPMLPLATAHPDCPLAGADAYMPGLGCARQQFVKQRHGPKVAGALWMYGPDHVCSTSGRRIKPNKVTPVGSEPTPFRNGTLSQRLKPLGQSVLGKIRGIHAFDCRFCAKRPGSLQHHIWSRALPLGLHMDQATSHQLLQQALCKTEPVHVVRQYTKHNQLEQQIWRALAPSAVDR